MKPEKKKLTGDMPYKTEDIQKILRIVGKNLKFRCITHILASTGIRIGAFSEIQLKHIQDMPNGCKSILVYDDDKAEYITFIHPEAVEALDQYQKVISELMIEDKFRLLKQIEKKDGKISELNQKDNEIDMLKHTILEIQNNLLEMRNTIKI